MRYGFFILLLLAFGCSKKESAQQKNAVLSIQQMGELATVEYTVTKIIKASDDKTWFKIGDRKILMTCEAVVKAGVDFSKITEQNFVIDGKNVTLTLPPPKIISLSLPPEKIIIEYESISAFREPFTSAERDALAVQAEKQIRNSIDSLGILLQAKANTATLLSNLLHQLGYEKVTIRHMDNATKPLLQ